MLAIDYSVRVGTLAAGKVYLPRCQAAIELAEYALNGVTRANGTQAIEHSIQVAELASQLGGKEEAILTALLHDTLEDTLQSPSCIARQIEELFGTRILNRVKLLTKQQGTLPCPAQRAMDEFTFQHRVAAAMLSDPVITLVKCCDLISNLDDIVSLGYCKALRYVGTAMDFLGIIEQQSPDLGRLLVMSVNQACEDLQRASSLVVAK